MTVKEHKDKKLSADVYDFVVSRICDGTFKPGDRITERQLAGELNISHVPVREAMEQLNQHNWTERFSNVGTFIKRYTSDELKEIYLLRMVIELVAIKIALPRITSEQLSELSKLAEELKIADMKKDRKAHVQADVKFHQIIVESSKSTRLRDLFKVVMLQSNNIGYSYYDAENYFRSKAIEEDAVYGHQEILNAIKERNADKAEILLKKHISIGADVRSFGLKEIYFGETFC